jgi:carboxymethylenebutenolidase
MAVLSHEGTHPIMYGSWPLPIGSGLRTGYLARPDTAGQFPVVLVLPALDGLTGCEKDLCRLFARSGLVAIAIDFYRQSGDPLQAYDDLSDARALTDIDEVHEFVDSNDVAWAVSGDVGILGVDVGGRFAIAAAASRSWVTAISIAYTPLTGDDDREFQVADYLDHLPVPVLGLYGAEDELIDVATVDEAQRRNEHGLWILYDGAGHGFLDVDGDLYHTDSAADAGARLIDFFKASLPKAIEVDLG